jgi:hypothetical protein
VSDFELIHRAPLADRISVRTADRELVPLIHPDAKALSMRPEVAQTYYKGLIERLETVRRTAGK